MTDDDDFSDEVDALIQYLETERELSEPFAVNVMGAAIQCLVRDNTLLARTFIRILAGKLNVSDELRPAS